MKDGLIDQTLRYTANNMMKSKLTSELSILCSASNHTIQYKEQTKTKTMMSESVDGSLDGIRSLQRSEKF